MHKKNYILILVLLVLFVVLNIIPSNYKVLSKVLKDSLLYIEKVINIPIKKVINTDQELIDENNELKKQLNDLKEVLDINTVLSDKNIINSTVINRNLNYWYDNITIDKGEIDGVKLNMGAIYNGYLVGKVTSINYKSSTVRLLTSNSVNKLSVKIDIGNKDIYGLLVGYNNNLYEIDGISDIDDIPISSLVMTTGLSDDIPSGIVIGTVSSVVKDNFDLTRRIMVKPSISMNNISYVTLVGRL